jgi:hypothetical protein
MRPSTHPTIPWRRPWKLRISLIAQNLLSDDGFPADRNGVCATLVGIHRYRAMEFSVSDPAIAELLLKAAKPHLECHPASRA